MLTIQNQAGTILAYLNNLQEATLREVLNGEYTINFIANMDPIKTDFLYDPENFIVYDNDLFRAITIEELHNEDGVLAVAVYAEHVSYDLIDTVFENFNYNYKRAQEVMTLALAGSEFILRNCDIDVNFKTNIQYEEECNAKQITIAIANNWRGELKYNRYYIDLLQMRGTNRGVDFRFGKNMQSIKRIINRAEDSIAYEVEVVQGAELAELSYFELGDTIRVIDDALKADYEVRIVELEKDLVNGMNSKVVLGSEIKDLRSGFASVKQKVEKAEKQAQESIGIIRKITDNVGNIVIGKLDEIQGTTSKILNTTGTFEHRDNALYWQDQPTKENSTFATLWSAQGIMFANSKDGNGGWIWQSALNADGLIANQVTANALYGLTVSALTILGATINGATINGGKINIGSDTSKIFIVLDSELDENYPLAIKLKQEDGRLADIAQLGGNADGGSLILKTTEAWQDEEELRYARYFAIVPRPDGTLISMRRNVEIQSIDTASATMDINGFNIIRINPAGAGGYAGYVRAYGNLYVNGNFEVNGTKNARVETEHFGKRLLYCDESDKVYFSTKGLANTELASGEYKYILRLDDIFTETIEPNSVCPYIVTATAYSNAHIWIDSIYDKYIIFKSDKPCKFAYVLQATRKGYAEEYLREVE